MKEIATTIRNSKITILIFSSHRAALALIRTKSVPLEPTSTVTSGSVCFFGDVHLLDPLKQLNWDVWALQDSTVWFFEAAATEQHRQPHINTQTHIQTHTRAREHPPRSTLSSVYSVFWRYRPGPRALTAMLTVSRRANLHCPQGFTFSIHANTLRKKNYR